MLPLGGPAAQHVTCPQVQDSDLEAQFVDRGPLGPQHQESRVLSPEKDEEWGL